MGCKVLHVFTIIITPKAFFDGQFKYLSDAGQDIWVVSASEEDADFVKANSVTYRQFDIRRKISPFSDIKTIISLALLMRREHFDIVVGHTPKGAMVAMLAAGLAGIHHRIYYRHGLVYTTATGLKRRILKTVERLTAACATKVVNVSPSLSKLAVMDRLNADSKQHVIGCGTCGGIDTVNVFNPDKVRDEDVAETRCSLGITPDTFVVGFCGRLCHDKGTVELVEGFKLFLKEHPGLDARLLLVGPYDEREVLPQQIKDDIRSTPSITCTGRIDQKKLPLYYSLMDVFAFPSYREGFGMTVIEASAMERPILVSRSHGCVDSIRENVTGRYIDLTPESIASGLFDMLDPQLRQRLGKVGRNFVAENFERTKMWPQILKLYNEIFSK